MFGKCDSAFNLGFGDLCFELVENNFESVIRPEMTFESSCGCTYYPGHAGVKGDERADTLAGKKKGTLISGLLLGRSEVLRILRHYVWAQSQGHHTIDRLEERGVERGGARRTSLKGREKAIINQTNIGTVSKATLGKLLRDGVERIWAFSERIDTIWN